MIIEKKLPKYRTVFISDLHLGSPHAQIDRLWNFLTSVTYEQLYLVGDVFDHPQRNLPESHRAIWRLILNRIHSGVRVTFIPGNHDKAFKSLFGAYDELVVLPDAVHITAAGRTIFISHGDQWDWLGSGSLMHLIDSKLPVPLWEVIRKLLRGFMRRHLLKFEKLALAAREGHNKVLCGHVHSPAIKGDYLNCGDWVKHCSAIVEHWDGRLELVHG